MRRLLLARPARQPAAQEIGPERDHRIVRFEREAAPWRRLIAGWHGRPAGMRMSGATAPTARARAERQVRTARWVDRPPLFGDMVAASSIDLERHGDPGSQKGSSSYASHPRTP